MQFKPQRILILETTDNGKLTRMLAGRYPVATLHVAKNINEAGYIVQRHQPDLAILDLEILDGQTHELINGLRTDSPQTTFIVASYVEEDTDIFRALKAGAKGYLLKDREEDQILKHLDNILAGQPTIAPEIANHMLSYFHKQPNLDELVLLSERENEILALIANGRKRTEVAEQLNITMNTVATHLKTIYRKLNINSRAEATLEAVRRGLIKKQ